MVHATGLLESGDGRSGDEFFGWDSQLDDVHGGHGKASAIDEASDVAVHPDVVEPQSSSLEGIRST